MFNRIYTIITRRVKRKLIVAIYRKPRTVRVSTREKAQHLIDNHGYPTTRCFPRTSDDAFRHLGQSTEWFFPPEQRWQDKVFLALGVCLWVAVGIYFWKTN